MVVASLPSLAMLVRQTLDQKPAFWECSLPKEKDITQLAKLN